MSEDKQSAPSGKQGTDRDGNEGSHGDDGGDNDVIHVAQTPTSTALLTQLRHNRIDGETRGLGAGHTGSPVFHMQRLTALALIPLGIWFVVGVVRMSTAMHADAVAWLSGPVKAVLMALFIIIGLRHAVIGIRIVLEDYVPDEARRGACVLIVQAIAVLLGTASMAALIHLAL